MTIPTRRSLISADVFIAGAPDAKSQAAPDEVKGRRAVRSIGNKFIISVSIGPDALDVVDAWATKRSMSRAAAIAYAISLLP